jgi:hypothetical protein
MKLQQHKRRARLAQSETLKSYFRVAEILAAALRISTDDNPVIRSNHQPNFRTGNRFENQLVPPERTEDCSD